MVFPLFVMALVWDATGLRHRRLIARPVRLRLGRWTLATNTVNLIVAAGFTLMGGFIIYLANTGQMTNGPDIQVATGQALAGWFAQLQGWLQPVPEPVLGSGLLLVAGALIWATLIGRHDDPAPASEPAENLSDEPAEHSCH